MKEEFLAALLALASFRRCLVWLISSAFCCSNASFPPAHLESFPKLRRLNVIKSGADY